MSTSLGGWARVCAVSALVCVVWLARLLHRDVVMCRDELTTVSEPVGWRTWPVVAKDAPYTIEGTKRNCVGHGLQCGLTNTELRTPNLCPRGGVSLDGYFNGSIYQSTTDIVLRESNGTTVASGLQHTPPTDAEAKFIVAFRPHRSFAHPVFVHVASLFEAVVLTALLTGMAAVALSTKRDPERARSRVRSITILAFVVFGVLLAGAALSACLDELASFS